MDSALGGVRSLSSFNSNRGKLSSRRIVVVRCKTVNGRSPSSTTTSSKSKKPGFRYDGANQRWVRDDRLADVAWVKETYTITPMSGPSYTVWPIMHTVLVEKGLKSITPEEASKLARKGAKLVDVRVAQDFEQLHAEGAVNVPLYRDVQGRNFIDNVKRLVMAVGFAMRATERNVDFVQDFEKVAKKGDQVIVMCSTGGSLATEITRVTTRRTKVFKDPERAFGRESRSLKACYELFEAGYKNVLHVQGGFSTWRYNGLPLAGERAK